MCFSVFRCLIVYTAEIVCFRVLLCVYVCLLSHFVCFLASALEMFYSWLKFWRFKKNKWAHANLCSVEGLLFVLLSCSQSVKASKLCLCESLASSILCCDGYCVVLLAKAKYVTTIFSFTRCAVCNNSVTASALFFESALK